MPDSKRYEGRPLHRFLELYVLEAIGELSPSDRQNLEKMAPKLKQIHGGGETWHEAIAAGFLFDVNKATATASSSKLVARRAG